MYKLVEKECDLCKKVMVVKLQENVLFNDEGDIPTPTDISKRVEEMTELKRRLELKRSKQIKSCVEL